MALVQIRPMTLADVAFADSLRAVVGWNQTIADWRRFLSERCHSGFLALADNQPGGTAVLTFYEKHCAWIGMLLVHPNLRRLGIGTELMRHCLKVVEESGVATVRLDATPLGQPLYESLGFVAEWSLSRWEKSENLSASPSPSPQSKEPIGSWSLSETIKLDAVAFGVARPGVLGSVAALAQQIRVPRDDSGVARGFGLLRPGMRAAYLGPIISTSPDAATDIIQSLLRNIGRQSVYWDIPDTNPAAVRIAETLGFKKQRSLLRMRRGPAVAMARPELIFGILDPSMG